MKLELPIFHAIEHGTFPTSFTFGHNLAMKASVLAWDFPSSKSLECGSSGKDNQRDLRSRDAQDLLMAEVCHHVHLKSPILAGFSHSKTKTCLQDLSISSKSQDFPSIPGITHRFPLENHLTNALAFCQSPHKNECPKSYWDWRRSSLNHPVLTYLRVCDYRLW